MATMRALQASSNQLSASARSVRGVSSAQGAPCCNALPSRRSVLEGAAASAILLAARPAFADEEEIPAAAVEAAPDLVEVEAAPVTDAAAEPTEAVGSSAATEPSPSTSSSNLQIYLDVKLEGQKLGRITVELLPGLAPVGAQRFADLAEGKQGVGYRLARFDRVTGTYVRCEGVKSLSYSADGYSPIAGGDSTQALEQEMASPSALHHGSAGLVSLVVKEEKEREVTERLVAMGGKLVTVKNVSGEAPNGSAFTITLGPAPELDATNLVVGRVVGGMEDVVAQLAALPRSKPRDDWFDKPFFETGKAIGDKRAIVAEKGFNRPFKRAIVSSGGIL